MADKELKSFLEGILRKYENDAGLVVLTMDLEEGTRQGDGFMSETVVANIVGNTGSGAPYSNNVFIKKQVSSKTRAELFSMDLAFGNEAAVYNDILPQMPEGIGDIPKCYYGGKDFIVMENLRAQGYKMFSDRAKGLDLAHAQLVIKALAKLHASSYRLIQEDIEKVSKLKHNTTDWLRNASSGFAEMFEDSLINAIFNIRQLGNKTFAESLMKLEPYKGRFFASLLEFQTSDLTVLGHGDLWVNNMMFRYQDGVVQSTKLLDLQAAAIMSPACDIWKFLYTCLTPDLLNSLGDQLISTYCTTFRERLLELNLAQSKIPDDDTVRKEIYSRELFGFLSAIVYVPAFYIDFSEKSMDLNEALSNKNFSKKFGNFFNKDLAERFAALLERCQLRGIL